MGKLTTVFSRIALLGLAGVLMSLSGCIVARDHGPYRYENGDRVDRYGHHEAHWCAEHRYDDHCR